MRTIAYPAHKIILFIKNLSPFCHSSP